MYQQYTGRCVHEAPQYEWEAVWIAWGGVIAQLSVAIPILASAAFFRDYDWGYFTPIIIILGYLNIVIAAINLSRDEGMDGRTAWRIIPLLLEQRRARRK